MMEFEIEVAMPKHEESERLAGDSGGEDAASRRQSERESVLAAVREGLADVRAGRTQPADAAIRRIAAKHGIELPRD